jgi:hypothetical protein
MPRTSRCQLGLSWIPLKPSLAFKMLMCLFRSPRVLFFFPFLLSPEMGTIHPPAWVEALSIRTLLAWNQVTRGMMQTGTPPSCMDQKVTIYPRRVWITDPVSMLWLVELLHQRLTLRCCLTPTFEVAPSMKGGL